MSARPQVSWLNIAFGLVLASAVVSVLWWLSSQAMTSNTVPLKAASDAQRGGALAARMWVDSARLYPGQILRVHAIFENRSRYPIGGFRFLDFRHDGLVETGSHWDQHRPSCITPAGAALSLPGAIQPGEAVRCEAELQADRERPTGQLGILAVYLWLQIEDNPGTQAKSAPRSVTRTGSLQLAPLAATTPLRERLSVVLRLSPNLLPILLVVLGWLIDRERQRREHSGQLDRARSDTVWTQQVARLLKYTQIYYLPIARNILALSTYHPNPGSSTACSLSQALVNLRHGRESSRPADSPCG